MLKAEVKDLSGLPPVISELPDVLADREWRDHDELRCLVLLARLGIAQARIEVTDHNHSLYAVGGEIRD